MQSYDTMLTLFTADIHLIIPPPPYLPQAMNGTIIYIYSIFDSSSVN